MGFFSFLLALSILVFHSHSIFGFYLIPADIAVDCFFILSGFYISLVLNEKYIRKNKSYRLFITNRFLRIYPLYWTVLILTLLFTVFKYFTHFGGPDNAVTNQLIPIFHKNFFSIANYLGKNLTLLICFDYIKTQFPYFFVGPQIWFVQIELMFYLIAPFIARQNKKIIVFFTLISLSLTFWPKLILSFLDNSSLLLLFFKNFIFFFLGIICYKFKLVPLILFKSKTNGLDRLFGKLAYPIFLSHIFFIKILDHFLKRSTLFTVTAILITTGGSYLLLKFIDDPINNWRQSRLKK